MAILVSTRPSHPVTADPRVTSNSKQFSAETVKAGGGVDKEKLKSTIAYMRRSHFEIGKFRQLFDLIR